MPEWMQPESTVSTHSHLKAAAQPAPHLKIVRTGFNTQPPEGGCVMLARMVHTEEVSTHSRLKAADENHQRYLGRS